MKVDLIVNFLLLFVMIASANAVKPPQDLSFDISYDSVSAVLSDKGLEIGEMNQEGIRKGYREYPELALPSGYFRAEAKRMELNSQKAERTYLIFDQEAKLQSFQYIFKWDNDPENYKGFRKCWVFYSDIKDLLIKKYGEPSLDEITPSTKGEDMPSGLKYTTIWRDADSSEIRLIISRQTHDAVIATIDAYLIFLLYYDSDYEIPFSKSESLDSEL